MNVLGKIRRLSLRDGLSISEICRRTGLATNTVKRWLKAGEIEWLNYATAGNSAPATAVAIERSVETVRRHLKSAMAKLAARTIAQTVAAAGIMGLFDHDRH